MRVSILQISNFPKKQKEPLPEAMTPFSTETYYTCLRSWNISFWCTCIRCTWLGLQLMHATSTFMAADQPSPGLDTRNGITLVMCTFVKGFQALLRGRVDLLAFKVIAVCFV